MERRSLEPAHNPGSGSKITAFRLQKRMISSPYQRVRLINHPLFRSKISHLGLEAESMSRFLQFLAWSISALLVSLAVIAWGNNLEWNLAHLTLFTFFPLLGLLAFNIMLSHYIAGALLTITEAESSSLKTFFTTTNYVVLALILAHPALFEWFLFRNHYGLPVVSYGRYYGPRMLVFLLLGNIALPLFLAYEFRRKFADQSWWHWVERASDLAMILVFFHGLKLGNQLQQGWYQKLWYIYGMILLSCIAYGLVHNRQSRAEPANT